MKKEEHYLQVAIHKLLTYENIFHFAVPNGGLRNIRVASALKAEGALAGVSDLILVLPKRIVFVEIKNGKEGRQSDSQKIFQNTVESLGFEYEIWKNIEQCQEFIKKFKKNEKN